MDARVNTKTGGCLKDMEKEGYFEQNYLILLWVKQYILVMWHFPFSRPEKLTNSQALAP